MFGIFLVKAILEVIPLILSELCTVAKMNMVKAISILYSMSFLGYCALEVGTVFKMEN